MRRCARHTHRNAACGKIEEGQPSCRERRRRRRRRRELTGWCAAVASGGSDDVRSSSSGREATRWRCCCFYLLFFSISTPPVSRGFGEVHAVGTPVRCFFYSSYTLPPPLLDTFASLDVHAHLGLETVDPDRPSQQTDHSTKGMLVLKGEKEEEKKNGKPNGGSCRPSFRV